MAQKKSFLIVPLDEDKLTEYKEKKEDYKVTDFKLCFICQKKTNFEPLSCPATKSTWTNKSIGYKVMIDELYDFKSINELPEDILKKLNADKDVMVEKKW